MMRVAGTIGSLVTFEGAPGIGRVEAVADGKARIVFFESPVEVEAESHWIALDRLRGVALDEQTRVFVPMVDGRWRAGRVVGGRTPNYFVRFPNVPHDVDIPEGSLRVRWDRPTKDPLQVLLAGANETPRFRDARQPVRNLLLAERAASMSATGLVSAGVGIHEHQVNAALRIINDPIQRYLLADEVGMGKTIQAGFVVRQLLIDDPTRRVGFIVPEALREQWQAELLDKFYLDDFASSDGRLPFAIRGHHEVDEWSKFQGADLLVIDEAHQLARAESPDDQPYSELATVAHAVPSLLLLSATPFSRKTTSHLALLHLLDPALFKWSDVDGFERLLEARRELAMAVFGLDEEPDPENPELLAYQFDALRRLLPEDELLAAGMATAMDAFGENGTADRIGLKRAVATVRAHVSETYRLHHRVIRNRRHVVEQHRLDEEGNMAPFEFTGRERPKVIRLDSAEGDVAVNAVETWLRAVSADVADREMDPEPYARAASVLVSRLGAGTRDDVIAALQARLLHASGETGLTWPELQRLTEAEVLPFEQRLLEDLEGAPERDGSDKLADAIAKRVKPAQRAVVFCGPGALAGQVAAALRALPAPFQLVHEHLVSSPAGARQEAVMAWRDKGGVLVADQSGDVGRNFQQAEIVIHARLPWGPNEFEQRIGRVDRYGTGRPAAQYVVSDLDPDGLHTTWLRVLGTGFGIFGESISAMQEIADSLADVFWSNLLVEGRDYALERMPDIGSALTAERRRINELDALESSYGGGEGEALAKNISSFDSRHEQVERAYLKLITGAEGFMLSSRRQSDGSIRFDRDPHQAPLVSPRLLARVVTRPESRTGYFDRWQLTAGRRMFRRGNPFIDGIESVLAIDDRGQASAQWRLDPGWPHDPLVYFGYDFLIEANLDPVMNALGHGQDGFAIARRRGDAALSPAFRRIWIAVNDMAPVADDGVITYLNQPVMKGRDVNLNASRIAALHGVLGGEGVLQVVGPEGYLVARDHLTKQADLVRVTQRAGVTVSERTDLLVAQSKARQVASGMVADPGAWSREIAIGRALEEGVIAPSVRLTAVTCLVRSAQSWSEYV
ncbi:Type III restriction protein res subunit [Nocardioides sp. PD653]|nr:Type III restriction protein res subunit [Nocardioides sp. PD653-B2]GAW55749.1 Type III restriction protein res subunit [Nocardioides sp. PD653]